VRRLVGAGSVVLLLHLSQGTAVAAAPWVQGGYVASLGDGGRNGSLTVSFVDAQRATVTLRLRRLAPRADLARRPGATPDGGGARHDGNASVPA